MLNTHDADTCVKSREGVEGYECEQNQERQHHKEKLPWTVPGPLFGSAWVSEHSGKHRGGILETCIHTRTCTITCSGEYFLNSTNLTYTLR